MGCFNWNDNRNKNNTEEMHCCRKKPVGSNTRSTTTSLPFILPFLVLWSYTIRTTTTTRTVISRHGMTAGVSASPVVVLGGTSTSSSSSTRRNKCLSDLIPLPTSSSSLRQQYPQPHQQQPFQRRCFEDDSTSPVDTMLLVSSSSALPVESASASGISSSVSFESSSSNKKNMIVSLFLYVKDSTVRTAQSCTQLYKNHQRCNRIRQKQSLYRNTIKEQWETDPDQTPATSKQMKQQLQQLNGGISYEEYIFLQLGKEDRGKVMNLAFLMYGAPKVLPYALMFNKNMLPSPFTQPNTSGLKTSGMSSDDPSNMEASSASPTTANYYETTLRQYERRQAMINTLYNMEKQFITLIMGEMTIGNSNGNSNFVTNLFTKSSSNQSSKSQQKMILHHVLSEMSDLFRRGVITMGGNHQSSNNNNNNNNNHANKETTNMGASHLLQKCEPYLYRTGTEYSGLELRLGHLPPCIVQGMANALFHHGIPNSITQLTPKVFHRRKLIGHIEKITKADEFLVSNNIDVASIPHCLLIEACHDRMIHVSSHKNMVAELRTALSDWLQLTKPKFVTSSSLLPSNSDSSMTMPPPMLETANVRMNRHSRKRVMTASSKSSPTVRPVASTTSTTSTISGPGPKAADPAATKICYNGNLARMILMAYYGCASLCDNANESMPATIGHLPQLLYSSSSSGGK